MDVHDSALKHGVRAEDAVLAPTKYIGFSAAGHLLETVVLTFDSGRELVIHAMKARAKYLDLLP